MNHQTSSKTISGVFLLLFMCVSGLVFDLSLPPFHGNAHAAQVTLAWDAENGVAGYKIYYGTVSKHYTSFIDSEKIPLIRSQIFLTALHIISPQLLMMRTTLKATIRMK